MNKNTEELIEYLRSIEQSDEIEKEGFLTDGKPHNLVKNVCILANAALITKDGTPNFAEHVILATHGFPVTCGERDSYGWLSGIIYTSKGKIVYG